MDIDSIKSKATKLYNLSKSSNEHEASNAKDKLGLLLIKYNVRLEEVVVDSITIDKEFEVEDQDLFELLIQVVMKILCTDNPSERNMMFYKQYQKVTIKLTDIEYVSIKIYYDHYKKLFNEDFYEFLNIHINRLSTLKPNRGHFKIAFYIKHKLFADIPPKEDAPELTMREQQIIEFLMTCIQSSREPSLTNILE
jgi:hypothetical protein